MLFFLISFILKCYEQVPFCSCSIIWSNVQATSVVSLKMRESWVRILSEPPLLKFKIKFFYFFFFFFYLFPVLFRLMMLCFVDNFMFLSCLFLMKNLNCIELDNFKINLFFLNQSNEHHIHKIDIKKKLNVLFFNYSERYLKFLERKCLCVTAEPFIKK